MSIEDVYVKAEGSFQSLVSLMKTKLGGVICPYAVGDIYITTSSTAPADRWNGTSWTQIKDRFLLAAGSSYTAGKTGGAATVTLTVDEMPSHTHVWAPALGYGSGSAGDKILYGNASTAGRADWKITEAAGGSAAHNNMPPYLVAYVWKRTA